MDTKQAGSIGGSKRMASMTKEQRRNLALKAISARYKKNYQGLSIKGVDTSDLGHQYKRCKSCGTKRMNHDNKSLLYMNIKDHEFIA